MTIDFTKEELQALAGLLDAAVRNAGLRAVKDAAKLLEKIEIAMEQEEVKDDG